MKRLLIATAITGAVIMSFSTTAASFDCAKAETNVENMICSNEKISSLDSSLSEIYNRMTNKPVEDQRAWIKNVRNKQENVEGLNYVYSSRIKELSKDKGRISEISANDKSYQNISIPETVQFSGNCSTIEWKIINGVETKPRRSMTFNNMEVTINGIMNGTELNFTDFTAINQYNVFNSKLKINQREENKLQSWSDSSSMHGGMTYYEYTVFISNKDLIITAIDSGTETHYAKQLKCDVGFK